MVEEGSENLGVIKYDRHKHSHMTKDNDTKCTPIFMTGHNMLYPFIHDQNCYFYDCFDWNDLFSYLEDGTSRQGHRKANYI